MSRFITCPACMSFIDRDNNIVSLEYVDQGAIDTKFQCPKCHNTFSKILTEVEWPTNGDRIRELTNDQLVPILIGIHNGYYSCPPGVDRDGCPGYCEPCWREWLNKPYNPQTWRSYFPDIFKEEKNND